MITANTVTAKKRTMRLLRLALVIAVFVTAAAAEEFDRSKFYLNEVRGTVLRLRGLDTDTSAPLSLRDLAAGGALRAADSYTIHLTPGRSNSITYKYNPTVVDDKSQALFVAFQEDSGLETAFGLSDRTRLSFSETTTTRTNVLGTFLSGSRVRTMGMVQDFGSGTAASTLKFSRTQTKTMVAGARDVNRTDDSLELATGFAEGWTMNLKAAQFETDEGLTGITGSSFATGLTTPFSGGPATWSYATSQQEGNGLDLRTESFSAALPVAIRGNRADIAFGNTFQERNGVRARSENLSVALPLKISGKDTKWAFANTYNNNFGAVSKSRTWDLALPLRISGEDVTWAYSSLYQTDVGQLTKSQNVAMRLPLRFLGEGSVIEHGYQFNYAKGVHTETRKTAFATPVKLLGKSYKLNYVIDGSDVGQGVFESRTTTVEIPFQVDGQAMPTTWSLVRSTGPVKGVATRSQKLDLAMPLEIGPFLVRAEHHSNYTYLNGTHTEVRDTTFAMPLKLFGKQASFQHTIHGQDTGGGMSEARTTYINNPFRLFDKDFGAEETIVTVRQGGVYTKTTTGKLTAPVAEGATVQRQVVETFSPGGRGEQRQMAVTLPKVKLSKKLLLSGQHVSTDTKGVGSSDVTNLSLQAQPLRPFTVEAKYTINDAGMTVPTLTQTQMLGKWAVSDSLSVQGQYNSADVLGGVANSLRVLELVRERGDSGIGLRAGLVSFGNSLPDVDNARRVELSLGDPKGIAVTAAYSEYDPAKMVSLNDDGIVALAVEHGTPDKMAVRWRYEDQPGRIAPAKAFDFAMPALGGTFQLTYAANQLAADGKTIRQASQIDASLARSIGDSLQLQLGYRYLDSRVPDVVDQFVGIQLDGGSEEGSGKIALAYLTGDFCQPDPGQKVPPGSALDLSYIRSWGENGRMVLSVTRRTAPMYTVADGTTEGRLELRKLFW